MEMNKTFIVYVNTDNEFVHRVIISGDLRRGTQLSGVDWPMYLNDAKNAAESRKVIFDLTDLTYWDTGGMADVIGAIVSINKLKKGTTKRAAIIRPKIEHLLKLANLLQFARRKFSQYTIEEEDIPVLGNESEVEKFVEG